MKAELVKSNLNKNNPQTVKIVVAQGDGIGPEIQKQ